MTDKSGNRGSHSPVGETRAQQARAARLKAALKANMARRKAQARARSVGGDDVNDPDPSPDGPQQDG